MSDFSHIQKSVFLFFETKVQKSDLFKIREKINKKIAEINKGVEKDKATKENQLIALRQEQFITRQQALKSVIPDWLTECAEKAIVVGKPMLKVSHPAKFSHGMTPYNGLYTASTGEKSHYITTNSLNSSYFDIAMSNGNLITHGRFLMCLIDGETVYEKLENNDDTWLFEFTKDEDQINFWANGLKHWLDTAPQIETSRLKQNYFPVEGGYHLLSPLMSSTLSQLIYEKIRFSRFDTTNSSRKKARKENKYKQGEIVDFPKTAIIKYGGSQSQNISVGNFERHGEAYLLPCAPPIWKSDLQPPLNTHSLYQGEFDRRAWRIAKELQRYLITLNQQRSNKIIRDHVKHLVNDIIDELLNYVAEVQNLKKDQGWSTQAEHLKLSHKLWLDPYRKDKKFQELRKTNDWQDDVCKDFGEWLNSKLENKKMAFEKIESTFWEKLLKKQLREFERGLEVTV